eukprot:TRINITY_DN6813_c0_g1_i1.p1 TRINITY_DN6813_c0_g1~~TRINITY_DN6813_c0_g1_i1.p1  ORF type:complete len:292 (+),score=11.62 TRINITY_DN6813_c0_g1_i1:60-935(+)
MNKSLHQQILIDSQSEVECLICFQVSYQPTLCPTCESLFCLSCIEQWLNTSNTCPHCRGNISSSSLRTSRFAQSFIDKIHSRCPNQDCFFEGYYSDVVCHLNVCQKRLQVCKHSNLGCDWTGNHTNLTNHQVHCRFAIAAQILEEKNKKIEQLNSLVTKLLKEKEDFNQPFLPPPSHSSCPCHHTGFYRSVPFCFFCDICKTKYKDQHMKAIHVCPSYDVCRNCTNTNSYLVDYCGPGCSCRAGIYPIAGFVCDKCHIKKENAKKALHLCPNFDICSQCVKIGFVHAYRDD